MPTRRLDDRIRQICADLAVAGRDPRIKDEEVESLLEELRASIQKKVQSLRAVAARKLLQGKDADLKDRRLHP